MLILFKILKLRSLNLNLAKHFNNSIKNLLKIGQKKRMRAGNRAPVPYLDRICI